MKHTDKIKQVISGIAGNFLTGALLVSVLSACERDSDSFENKLFFDASGFKNEVRVATDENVTEVSKELTVSMAQPEPADVAVSFVKSPELLDTYRKAYNDPKALLLPEEHFDLTGLQTVIKAGQVSSDVISFDFKGLEKELFADNRHYVMPVTVISESVTVLESARTMYFVVKEASLVNVAADLSANCAWPDWGGFGKVANLSQFTFEALINGHAYDNESCVHTIMGIEDNFLLRVGDTKIEKNQIQVAVNLADDTGSTEDLSRNDVVVETPKLQPGVWYHVAVTFDAGKVTVYVDGIERATGDFSEHLTSVDFSAEHSDEMDGKPRCFWIGYSYDDKRPFNGLMSEVRVWDKALTKDEINVEGHFYKIRNPEQKENLIAYWKFNEEKGKTVRDWSASGRHLTGDHDFLWYPVELPEID